MIVGALPSIELMRAGQSDLLVRLDTVIAVVDEKATLLRTLEDNFDQLITDLPDEIEAAFRIHWDPARKYIDSFYDQYIAPVLDTANVIRTEVHELLDRQQEQLVRLLTDNQNPGDLLANVLTLPEPLRSRQLDRINAIFQLAGYFEAQRKRTRAQQIFKREQFRLNGYLRRLAQKRTIVAEVPSYTPAVREISTIDAWYKGISP